jgi:hypothetical protein
MVAMAAMVAWAMEAAEKKKKKKVVVVLVVVLEEDHRCHEPNIPTFVQCAVPILRG